MIKFLKFFFSNYIQRKLLQISIYRVMHGDGTLFLRYFGGYMVVDRSISIHDKKPASICDLSLSTMKFIFKIPNKGLERTFEADVDPALSQEALLSVLNSQYNLNALRVRWIFNGKIVQSPKPLADIPENSQVFIFIQTQRKPNVQQANPAPAQVPDTPLPQLGTPQPMSSQLPVVATPVAKPDPLPQTTISFERLAQSVLDALPLEKFYDEANSFFSSPEKLRLLSEKMTENIAMTHIFSDYLKEGFLVSRGFDELTNEALISVLGIVVPPSVETTEMKDAYFRRPAVQRQDLDYLFSISKANDDALVMAIYDSTGFDREEAAAMLSRM